MKIPAKLIYSSSHEWVNIEKDGSAVIGITDHGQDALGDLIYVELPQIGDVIIAGMKLAIVESMKAATDICSPLSGEVVDVNSALLNDPKIVNISPYDEGWFLRLKLSNREESSNLINPADYRTLVESEV
tara:strand:+ start:42 stop:431 length:390 start_codon:yes stop_codon:yes gene_type:complete